MVIRRSIITLSRRAVFTPVPRRTFTTSFIRRDAPNPDKDIKKDPKEGHSRLDPIPGQTEDMIPFDRMYRLLLGFDHFGRAFPGFQWLTQWPSTDVETEKDLLPPGAAPGTIPTDLEQATGLERFEILGKMQGIDVFDMKPLDASRVGMFYPPHRPSFTRIHSRKPMTTNTIYAWLSETPLTGLVLPITSNIEYLSKITITIVTLFTSWSSG